MLVEHTVYLCAHLCISADISKGNSNILERRGVITSHILEVTLLEGQKLISFCCFQTVCVCVRALAKTMPPKVATVVYHSSH